MCRSRSFRDSLNIVKHHETLAKHCILKHVKYYEPLVRVSGLELLSANGGMFEINQLLLADVIALVAGSEEKLCRLESEFGRVCERRKLRVNVGKSKVMRCSRYGNVDRIHMILNSEPFEKVDCFFSTWGHKWQPM